MMTARHLRRMSRIELVQYGLEGERQRRRASDELFRRDERRFREKGLLARTQELAEPDATAETPLEPEPDDRPSSLL
jgi:hypothetical protein